MRFCALSNELGKVNRCSTCAGRPGGEIEGKIYAFLCTGNGSDLMGVCGRGHLRNRDVTCCPRKGAGLVVACGSKGVRKGLMKCCPSKGLHERRSCLGSGYASKGLLTTSNGRLSFRPCFMTPRFPKNVSTLTGLLGSGLTCPLSTIETGARKGIVLQVIVSRGKRVATPQLVSNISPLLSGRTVHVIRTVNHARA